MAHTSTQNAAKCLIRANAEFAQAAADLRRAGATHHADTLDRWSKPLGDMIEAVKTTGGAGGGEPAKRAPKAKPAAEAAATPPDLVV